MLWGQNIERGTPVNPKRGTYEQGTPVNPNPLRSAKLCCTFLASSGDRPRDWPKFDNPTFKMCTVLASSGVTAPSDTERRQQVSNLEFRVQGVGCRGSGTGCRVQGVGCRVSGAGFRVHGFLPRVDGGDLAAELPKRTSKTGSERESERARNRERACERSGERAGERMVEMLPRVDGGNLAAELPESRWLRLLSHWG